jgi:hypothetical protein
MKRKLKPSPKPTKEETERLVKYLWMEDWHFEVTIKKNCTEILSHPIYWNNASEDQHWVYSTVFGLKAIKVQTGECCIANIFIRYENRVYQVADILSIGEMMRLLKKETAYNDYKSKLWDRQWEERKKLIEAKQKAKAKVRKLKIRNQRAVA